MNCEVCGADAYGDRWCDSHFPDAEAEHKAVLAWLVAQPDTAWFDTADVAAGAKVDPARVYFRCQPQLEATAPQWAWLNESQFIGTGRRAPDGVFLSFYRVV